MTSASCSFSPTHSGKRTSRSLKSSVMDMSPCERAAVLQFATPVRAVSRGQIAVFYDGDRVLGGGRITAASNASAREASAGNERIKLDVC